MALYDVRFACRIPNEPRASMMAEPRPMIEDLHAPALSAPGTAWALEHFGVGAVVELHVPRELDVDLLDVPGRLALLAGRRVRRVRDLEDRDDIRPGTRLVRRERDGGGLRLLGEGDAGEGEGEGESESEDPGERDYALLARK